MLMLVILGFDGLDPYAVEEYGAGAVQQDTFTRMRIPEEIDLHTEVIWPTIITGRPPGEHGLTRTQARKWNNPLVQAAAWVGDTLFPRDWIMPIGRAIQEMGFKRSERGSPEYYDNKNIETIFTNTRSKVIGLPGYNPSETTDELRRMGGLSTHNPVVEIDVFIDHLREELEQRRKQTLEHLDLPVDILMVYSYSTDMAGHIFWDDEEFMRGWYEDVDDYVKAVQDELGDDDELLILSDHGMEEGKHRREAVFSFSEAVDTPPDSVLSVKPFVDGLLYDEKESHAEITDRMKGLGYI